MACGRPPRRMKQLDFHSSLLRGILALRYWPHGTASGLIGEAYALVPVVLARRSQRLWNREVALYSFALLTGLFHGKFMSRYQLEYLPHYGMIVRHGPEPSSTMGLDNSIIASRSSSGPPHSHFLLDSSEANLRRIADSGPKEDTDMMRLGGIMLVVMVWVGLVWTDRVVSAERDCRVRTNIGKCLDADLSSAKADDPCAAAPQSQRCERANLADFCAEVPQSGLCDIFFTVEEVRQRRQARMDALQLAPRPLSLERAMALKSNEIALERWKGQCVTWSGYFKRASRSLFSRAIVGEFVTQQGRGEFLADFSVGPLDATDAATLREGVRYWYTARFDGVGAMGVLKLRGGCERAQD